MKTYNPEWLLAPLQARTVQIGPTYFSSFEPRKNRTFLSHESLEEAKEGDYLWHGCVVWKLGEFGWEFQGMAPIDDAEYFKAENW